MVNGNAKKKKRFLVKRLLTRIISATHFNKMITEFPPQTSSRFAASQWLCGMHNKVNERLHKPIFDCSGIESKYPCGCGTPEDE